MMTNSAANNDITDLTNTQLTNQNFLWEWEQKGIIEMSLWITPATISLVSLPLSMMWRLLILLRVAKEICENSGKIARAPSGLCKNTDYSAFLKLVVSEPHSENSLSKHCGRSENGYIISDCSIQGKLTRMALVWVLRDGHHLTRWEEGKDVLLMGEMPRTKDQVGNNSVCRERGESSNLVQRFLNTIHERELRQCLY